MSNLPTTPSSDPATAAPQRLSEELSRLIGLFAQRPVTLAEVVRVLHGRAYTLLLILLSLPFLAPVPMPGLSTPFGLVIAMIGFRLALRQKPGLPDRLLNMTLPPRFFANVLGAGRRIIRGLEWFLRPRHTYLVDPPLFQHALGFLVLTAGLLLLLPVPVPFANFLPAWTIVLTAAALMERDAYAAVLAVFMFMITLAFFAALAWGGTEAVAWLWEMWRQTPEAEATGP